MWYRADLKQKARACIRANYWPLVLISLIFWLVSGNAFFDGLNINLNFSIPFDFSFSFRNKLLWSWHDMPIWTSSGLVILILDIFFLPPLIVGCNRFFLTAMDERPLIDCILQNFQRGYGNTIKVMFLRSLFTVLWGLLLIIPGIVKSYEYRMIPYLLAEYPEMPREEVFQASRDLMYGHKLNTLVLDLSFLGWIVLSACTFGLLGIFYVIPYRNMTNAQLYRALCQADQSEEPTL